MGLRLELSCYLQVHCDCVDLRQVESEFSCVGKLIATGETHVMFIQCV